MKAGEIIAGFRAESVLLRQSSKGATLHPQFVEELGASRHLHCELAGEQIIVTSQSDQEVKAGRPLHITIQPEHIQLFNPETGGRIESEVFQSTTSLPQIRKAS